jgi:uncharacterized integral membrane protein
MRAVVFILIVAFVLLVFWIALVNGAEVVLRLGPGWSAAAPLGNVILAAVFAGVFFTGVLAVIEGLALRLDRRRLRRRLKSLEEELHDLRNIGLRAAELQPARTARPAVAPDTGDAAEDVDET